MPETQHPFERGKRQEDLILTARAFIEDNASPLAQNNRDIWIQRRRNGKLKGKKKCADARMVTVEDVTVRSIAGADETSPGIIADPDVEAWGFYSHFGEGLKGCGGLGARESLIQPPLTDFDRYIARIAHHDFLIQSLLSAEEIAEISGKPVLAAAQDHLDLTIYPLGFFYTSRGRVRYESPIKIKDIADGQYNPEKLYANGIPTIPESELPDVLLEMLDNDQRKTQEIRNKYTTLRDMQRVQKPRIIFVTTDIRPLSVKYPNLSGIPGSIFKVHLARTKIDGVYELDSKLIRSGVAQIEYPFGHAVEHNGHEEESFSTVDTMVVETGDLGSGEKLWDAAEAQSPIREWTRIGNKKVILLQSAGGITHTDAFKEITF